MIDYALVNNKYRSSVKDVKAITGEETVSQYCLVCMDMMFKEKVKRKVNFRKTFEPRRLRESGVKEEFAKGVSNKCDGNEDWCGLKRKLLDVASEVCGYTKGQPRNFEIKIWMKLFVERESYLGFGSRAVMRKIGRNILRQKKMLRE